MSAKKVFICHASEDKDRFVLGFAGQLRATGIDAWVDRWEILPGDSLVDRVFEEGIKNAGAMIIVLSRNSVGKPWVKDELNTGVVEKIEKGVKLIPVVLDDCEIPECLKSIVRIRIGDVDSYDREYSQIVNAILGQYEKPPLGAVPAYVHTKVDVLPGLSRIDTIVLKAVCEISLESGSELVDAGAIESQLTALEVDRPTMLESLEVLSERGQLELGKVLGPPSISHVRTTRSGFEAFARAFIPEYSRVFDEVTVALIEARVADNAGLASTLQQPRRLIDHVLDVLVGRGLIKFGESFGGYKHRQVFYVSPQLKRMGR